MLLSKLVYLSIKNVIYYDDKSFTYQAFMDGNFDDTPDYATNINNIFTPINEAIARLSDLERIPYQVIEVNLSSLENNRVISLPSNCKEVISVAQIGRVLDFKPFGVNKIRVNDEIFEDRPIFVEFKEDIKQFDHSDLALNDENERENDIDLKSLGISDSACNYIMEYVMSKLSEDISPEIANMHLTRAEQYFANIRTVKSAFHQELIERKYSI